MVASSEKIASRTKTAAKSLTKVELQRENDRKLPGSWKRDDRRGASRRRKVGEQRSISSTLWFTRSRDKIRGPEKKIIIPLHWYDKYKQAGSGRGLHYSPLKRALNQLGCLRNSRKRGRAVTFVSKITAGRSAAMNLFDESRTSRGAARGVRARGKNSELNTCQKVLRY